MKKTTVVFFIKLFSWRRSLRFNNGWETGFASEVVVYERRCQCRQ